MRTNSNNSNIFLFFSIFWSLSTLIHQLIWTEWSAYNLPLGWVVSIICVANLLTFGKHTALFMLAILSSALWYVIRQPLLVNHLYYETVMSLLMSSVIIFYYINKKLKSTTVEFNVYFANNAIPILRSSLIILYFFVVLHKLNYDYFKTDISCGGILFENMLQTLKLTNINFVENFYSYNQIAIANFSIYFSIVTELAIPILLVFRKTRNIGLVVGLIFHFTLALEGLGAIVSFTAMMFTYLLLFSSDEIINKSIKIGISYRGYLRIALVTAIIIISISFLCFSHNIFIKVVGLIYIIYTVTIIIFCAKHIKLKPQNALRFTSKSLVYLIFPILIFINGFAPYLGLKTQTSFSMFSNLVTENGSTNHFFIPSSFQVFDYQNEIVIIESTDIKNLSSDDAWNKGKSYNYLLFAFIKKVNKVDSGYVNFRVNDSAHYIKKQNGKVIVSTIDLYQNIFLEKLLLFRPIYSENISYCQQ